MAKFRALLVTGDRQSIAVTELTDADLMEGDAEGVMVVVVVHPMQILPVLVEGHRFWEQ
jgi:hypothetical protein